MKVYGTLGPKESTFLQIMVWDRVNFSLLLVCERVSFFSCSRKGCHFLKMFQGRVNFVKVSPEKDRFFQVCTGKGTFFHSLYGKGSPFVKIVMGNGLFALKFCMGKGLIFQIIGMATKRVRDPAWPSLPIPF